MSGRLIQVPGFAPSVVGFVPNPLPREIELPARIARACEEAAGLLGWVAGAGEILDPWMDLFLRREAIASSAIEGTVTTAHDLYLFEAQGNKTSEADTHEQREVHNYVVAMGYAQKKLETLPFSWRIVREAHAELMRDVRGGDKRPGEFRIEQNWIGNTRNIEEARFIPPPRDEMMKSLDDLEKFFHEDTSIPNLIRLAMIHYQFETIHPFGDGNGRMGRLMIPLQLCSWGVLPAERPPRIYLSAYFEKQDREYRNLMLGVSQRGDWPAWYSFFVEAIRSEAQDIQNRATQLRQLQDRYLQAISDEPARLQRVVKGLFKQPVMQIKDIAQLAGITRQQATTYAKRLCDLKITSHTERKWGRYYIAREIMKVFFDEPGPTAAGGAETSNRDSGPASSTEPLLPFGH